MDDQDMRNGPTVAEVQDAINTSWDDENASEDSHYVPPYASGFILADASRRHIMPSVKHTYILGDIDNDVQAYAIVHLNGDMRSYDVAGWRVTLVTQDAALAKRLNGNNVGDKSMMDGEIVVSIDGGLVVAYEEAIHIRDQRQLQEKERQQVQEQARQQQIIDKKQQIIDKIRLTTIIRERGDRLRQDKRNLADFQQLTQFSKALSYEMNIQQKLLTQLNFGNWKIGDTEKMERDLLKAEEREETTLAPMRQQADVLRQEQRRQAIEQQRQQDIEQQRQNRLYQEQELQKAERLRKQQIIQQEATKRKQKAIDKRADQYERTEDPITYENADFQLEAITHHIGEGASIDVIRERATHLRSRCMKSRNAVPSTSAQAPTLDGVGTKVGAIMGGIFGITGGPVGMALGQP